MTRVVLTIFALLAFALAGCGDEAHPVEPATFSQTTAPANPAAGVPDACSLLTAQRLTELLGLDAGSGSPQSVSPDRSICLFSGNVITAVEVATNYEASRRVIEDLGSTTTDIPGLGTAAFFDSNGQVVAKGTQVFVAVTAAGVSTEKLIAAVRELLAAADSQG